MVVATIKYAFLKCLSDAPTRSEGVITHGMLGDGLSWGRHITFQLELRSALERYKTDTLLSDALWSVTVRWARLAC